MNLNDLVIFVAVIEAGSITAAADRLDLPKSSVSRTLTRLENDLGVRLLQRTTRSLHLTDAGRQFHDRVAHHLSELNEARDALASWQKSPRGHIRVTMPVELGIRFMGNVVAEFMRLHPQVSVEAELSGRLVDLVTEGVDVGLRIGDFNDATLIGRRLGQLNAQLFASPDYLRQHGTPTEPAALAEHEFVLFRQPHENQLRLNSPQGLQEVNVRGRLSTNNAQLQLDAVCAGLGMALLPRFLAEEALQQGRLQAVLPACHMRLGDLWAVTPSRANMPAGLRAFIDFLAERVRQHPWFD